MDKDEERRKAQGERLAEARKAAGYRSSRDAALSNGWNEGTYRAHEKGRRTIGVDDAERYARRYRAKGVSITGRDILFGGEEDDAVPESHDKRLIPIMGYVGAGGDVDPEYEQVPFDGLEQIELRGPTFLDDPVGFIVRGELMMPRYDEGSVVLVERDPSRDVMSLIGDEAVITTHDGKRYLRKVMPTDRRGIYRLVALNADSIDVAVRWASKVEMVIPRDNAVRRRQTRDAQELLRRLQDGLKVKRA